MILSPRLRWKLNRWRESVQGWWDQLTRTEAKPRVCPSCGVLIGMYERACPSCGASVSALSLSGLKRATLKVIPETTPITYVLMGVNFVLFALTWLATTRASSASIDPSKLFGNISGEVLFHFGAKHGAAIFAGEYWRLVAPIFLHAGLIHLAFNSLVLFDLGPRVEETYGSARFLFLYLVTGVAGFIVSAWWYPPWAISIGASGALFGLIGLMISHTQRSGGSFAREIRRGLWRWAIYAFIFGLFFGADNAAHAGGLLAGLGLGYMVSDRPPSSRAQRLRLEALGWLAGLVILWAFVMVLRHFPTR